ncbi:MAG: glycosyltransferase family 2 protein [Chloroflexota bacterium]|nr:glycosyltransferase family 2 protein [Chloroflexota bacterium]
MDTGHVHRATIPPVSTDVPRPLWSVMIPTYNCATYLRETLVSVLAQDPGPRMMQIEVVDDHSTLDDPAAVVAELGHGRVEFYRQERNVGYIHNFETCLKRARGHLIHLLHGDDYVREGFYRKLQCAFTKHPEIGAAFCRHIYMDAHGHWQTISSLEQPESGLLADWLERIASGQRIATPSIVVRRDVYEELGGFDCRIVRCGEDWEMWVRIATRYPVWYEVEPLAVYRVKHSNSLTGGATIGELVRDMRKATEIIESYLPSYLPATTAHESLSRAREMYAFWALSDARRLLRDGDVINALIQTREAIHCHHSPKVMGSTISLIPAVVLSWIRQMIYQQAISLKRVQAKHR